MHVARLLSLSSCVLCGCLLDGVEPVRSLQGRAVVAIVAEPAEAAPGEPVHYRAIVASPEGPEDALRADWSFCRSPRPLSENAAVSVPCATLREQPIAADGLETEATIPADACARFGPETSAGLRPTDADQSGGYYQPVRLVLDGMDELVAVHRHRIQCALANAPIDVVQRFQRAYRRNSAPGILALRIPGAQGARLAGGERVELELELAPDAAEDYLVYDRLDVRLSSRVEQLDVRWFASAGALETDRSVPEAGHASVAWRAPAGPGSAWIWAVVRDERGGTSVAEQRFDVSEE